MTDPDLPHGIFDAESYWQHQLEAAGRAAEVARRNLAVLALKAAKEEGVMKLLQRLICHLKGHVWEKQLRLMVLDDSPKPNYIGKSHICERCRKKKNL